MFRLCAWVAAALVSGWPGPAVALEKEVSLVTKKPVGELAVAGRLAIDLHAEFMLARSYDTETALNWYNCGYSGGGGGGVSSVGGNFGDFGFQVPYQERDRKYPHAVMIGKVPAARFDGNNVLTGNFPVADKILEEGNMALEAWIHTEMPAPGTAILGWQSQDGKETSAPLIYPNGFKGSAQWRHLVVNCTRDKEDWYLDGVKVAGGPRRMLVKKGHVMVLGGASALKPSFKGDLAALRLHDEAMTMDEITHNLKGGVMLGTEMHNWWRTEPDKWWVKESEHFRHAVDQQEMKGWSQQQLKEFNDRLPGMFNLAELIYHNYSERHAMRSSVVSLQPAERGDGIKYKIPIQPNEGSVMGFDGHFGWACQGAGFINPHELVHGWQAMTGGLAGNFWEAHANFPQTYVGVYQTIPVITTESPAFPASGRTYYHDRLMFEHLAQTPAFGPMFISKLWYDGPTADNKSPYPWLAFERINPCPDRTLADEYTRMAMRNITWDYQTFKECGPGEKGNTAYGNDGVASGENLYRRTADASRNDLQQTLLRSYVLLAKIPYEPEWWRVPKELAPQQLGWNICPLKFQPGKVSALLAGYVDKKRGGDWRAAFVGVDAKGKPVYGEVFPPGKSQGFDAKGDLKELYLVVCATPSNIMDVPMTGDFRSFEQEPFPYKVKLAGCEPLDVMLQDKPKGSGAAHANGGGFVERSAQVDATAYVGPDARVLGNSKVLGNARIEDFAVVNNATVKDNAVVSGHALVCEESTVGADAKVRGYAVVKGRTTVTGNAKILEHGVIATQKTCSDHVVVKGVASVYGGNQSGSAMLDGYYAKGNEITRGKWFTWSWSQGKNPGEEDVDFGGLYADYDFHQDHGWMARDAFGATWGYLVNGPKIEIRQDRAPDKKADAKTRAEDGALRLNGKDQFVELPNDVADMGNCTYTAEVMWNGAAEGVRIFEFANPNGDVVCLTPSVNGKLSFVMRKGTLVEAVTAPAVAKGAWATVQVILEGKTASLFVNGTKVAEKKNMTLRPDSIRASQCYLGRGLKGGFFGGLIGRFTIHSAAIMDRVPPSPNPAAFEMPPMFVAPGTLAMSAKPGADPLGGVEYCFEEEGGKWTSGWTNDPRVRVKNKDAARPARYRLKMRDKCGNETRYSEVVLATGFGKDVRTCAVTPDAPAVIEAEHAMAVIASLDGKSKWEKQTNPAGFVGEGFMVVPDIGALNDPFVATAARMDYAVNFTKAGRYFLWVRADGNNGGGASIHAGFGLNPEDWGLNLHTGNGRYAWTRSREFQIETPGAYLFSIWMREDGAMVDRFLFTANEKYEPSPDQRAPDKVMIGEGPPETPMRPLK